MHPQSQHCNHGWITVVFVTGPLPLESSTMIMAVVEHFSKAVHWVPLPLSGGISRLTICWCFILFQLWFIPKLGSPWTTNPKPLTQCSGSFRHNPTCRVLDHHSTSWRSRCSSTLWCVWIFIPPTPLSCPRWGSHLELLMCLEKRDACPDWLLSQESGTYRALLTPSTLVPTQSKVASFPLGPPLPSGKQSILHIHCYIGLFEREKLRMPVRMKLPASLDPHDNSKWLYLRQMSPPAL